MRAIKHRTARKETRKGWGGDSGAATTSSAVSSAGVMVNVDQSMSHLIPNPIEQSNERIRLLFTVDSANVGDEDDGDGGEQPSTDKADVNVGGPTKARKRPGSGSKMQRTLNIQPHRQQPKRKRLLKTRSRLLRCQRH